jgi:UDP-N-acetylglucosamine 2-epimerase (non-hydrolysing)
MRLSIILGTRPEIIKFSPIIRVCEQENIDYNIIHTNQHYSYEMDKIFFEDLHLPEPNYNLNIGSGTHGKQTGKILTEVEKVLIDDRTDIIMVQGDTNTVLGGALAASKLGMGVAHVEAGLRSYDRSMPEEINRVMSDHISDYLFPPTEVSKSNLLEEGIDTKKMFVVGNTVVDATFQNLEIAKKSSDVLENMGLSEGGFFLMTVHRAENTDNKERLMKIIEAVNDISETYGLPIIYPIHPRAKKMLESFNLMDNVKNISNLHLMEPVGYLDFLMLENNAKLILTDSGGIQEEACILNIPCLTLRDNTERPETVDVGKNMIVGVEKENVLNGIEKMLSRRLTGDNPFGDGRTGEKIINIITRTSELE